LTAFSTRVGLLSSKIPMGMTLLKNNRVCCSVMM